MQCRKWWTSLHSGCPEVQTISISTSITVDLNKCGENVASSGNRISWSEVIQGWYNEAKDWRYGVGSINGKTVGHFTQVHFELSELSQSCQKNLINLNGLYNPNRDYKNNNIQFINALNSRWFCTFSVILRLFGTTPTKSAVAWPTVPTLKIFIIMSASTAHRKNSFLL